MYQNNHLQPSFFSFLFFHQYLQWLLITLSVHFNLKLDFHSYKLAIAKPCCIYQVFIFFLGYPLCFGSWYLLITFSYIQFTTSYFHTSKISYMLNFEWCAICIVLCPCLSSKYYITHKANQ